MFHPNSIVSCARFCFQNAVVQVGVAIGAAYLVLLARTVFRFNALTGERAILVTDAFFVVTTTI